MDRLRKSLTSHMYVEPVPPYHRWSERDGDKQKYEVINDQITKYANDKQLVFMTCRNAHAEKKFRLCQIGLSGLETMFLA